jgi:hypothetical protein
MLRLYRFLFSVRFWRSVSLRSFWREAGLSIRRSHKDPRARKFLLAFLFLLLLLLLCLAYFVLLVKTGAIFIFPFVIPFFWWIRRGHKRDDVPQITLRRSSPVTPVDAENPEVRVYLGQMAVLYATMLDRAGSESFLRNQELPDGIEVISRRTHIDLLRMSEVWDKMATADREAMMIADGQWPPELIASTSLGLEPLRLSTLGSPDRLLPPHYRPCC